MFPTSVTRFELLSRFRTRVEIFGLFEEILYKRNVTIRKYPVVVCPLCGRQQERRTVIRRIQRDQQWLFCEDDGERISLPKATERLALSSQDRPAVAHDQTLSNMRTTYETALVRVKGHIRSRKGEEHTSFPPLLYRRVYGDFTQEKNYFVTLFDLVLTLYGIAFDDPIVRDLREKLQGDRDAVVGKTFGK